MTEVGWSFINGKQNGMYGKKHSKEKIGRIVKDKVSGENSHRVNVIKIYNSKNEIMFISKVVLQNFVKKINYQRYHLVIHI